MALSRSNLFVIDHPLIKHKLALIRNKNTPTLLFKALVKEIGMLMAYEVTKDLPVVSTEVTTPLVDTNGYEISGKKLVFAPVLRAGLGMLDGFLAVCPAAKVGHIGLYRDHDTLEAKQYLFKMPSAINDRDVIILDPMLATGNSAVAAVNLVQTLNPKKIKFVSLISAPEGIEQLSVKYPNIPIYTASVDECLNKDSYIVPGLGDAGDRIFGTNS